MAVEVPAWGRSVGSCPACGRFQTDGHREGCVVARALASPVPPEAHACHGYYPPLAASCALPAGHDGEHRAEGVRWPESTDAAYRPAASPEAHDETRPSPSAPTRNDSKENT
jgi:hypothetical protein